MWKIFLQGHITGDHWRCGISSSSSAQCVILQTKIGWRKVKTSGVWLSKIVLPSIFTEASNKLCTSNVLSNVYPPNVEEDLLKCFSLNAFNIAGLHYQHMWAPRECKAIHTWQTQISFLWSWIHLAGKDIKVVKLLVHHQLTCLWLLLRFTNLNNSKWFQLPFVIEILQICITFCWHYSCEPYPLMREQIAYCWWTCVQIAYHWQLRVQIAYHWQLRVQIAYHWRMQCLTAAPCFSLANGNGWSGWVCY